MSIPALVDKLEKHIHSKFESFEKAEKAADRESDGDTLFKLRHEMAMICRQFEYLHEWMDTYNKARYFDKLAGSDHDPIRLN